MPKSTPPFQFSDAEFVSFDLHLVKVRTNVNGRTDLNVAQIFCILEQSGTGYDKGLSNSTLIREHCVEVGSLFFKRVTVMSGSKSTFNLSHTR